MKNTTGVVNKNVRKLADIIEEFRKLDPEIQAQQILIFLIVVDKPNITVTELAKLVGVAKSSASRNLAALGKSHRKGKPGHNLVEAVSDPEDARLRLFRPTHKGRQVYESLLRLLVT